MAKSQFLRQLQEQNRRKNGPTIRGVRLPNGKGGYRKTKIRRFGR